MDARGLYYSELLERNDVDPQRIVATTNSTSQSNQSRRRTKTELQGEDSMQANS